MSCSTSITKRVVTILLAFCLVFSGAVAYQASGSSTQQAQAQSTYKITVSTSANVVTVFKLQSNGKYKAIKSMLCSTGLGDCTIKGNFNIGGKWRWLKMHEVYGQYVSQISGNYLFHSVWYYSQNKSQQSTEQFNNLGHQASAGCVRLCVADAKWIYENIPAGTPVHITGSYYVSKLGKPKAIKVAYGDGTDWDPTDPDPNNPYMSVKGIGLTVPHKTMEVGTSSTISARVLTKYSYYYGNTGVKFSSSNSKVVSVTSAGTLKAHRLGTAIITAKLTKKGKTYKATKKIRAYRTYTLSAVKGVIARSGTNKNKVRITKKVYDSSVKIPTATLYRKGYTFKGWYTKGTGGYKVTTYAGLTNHGVKKAYAQWTPITYKITYTLNDGTQAANQKTTYKTNAAVTLKNPTRKGYTFKGWFTTATFKAGTRVTKIAKGSIGNKHLYAKWALKYYTITYVLNADDAVLASGSRTTYTVNLPNNITLLAPTREGYVFTGWYTDEALTKKVSLLIAGTVGNRTYYAGWEEIVTPDPIPE